MKTKGIKYAGSKAKLISHILSNIKELPSYYIELLSHLNSLQGYHGWFSENYGGLCVNGSSISVDGKKKLWQLHNTLKLDVIIDEIEKLKLEEITKEELIEIFKSKGNLMKTIQIDYKQNVMANMKWTNDWLRDNQSQHQEYIFLIETKG